jgi:hypothetical integral membrane protein (TIGR02206 family)
VTSFQIGSLAFAFLGPVILWAMHRRRPHPALERNFARSIAGLLVIAFFWCAAQKIAETLSLGRDLGLHGGPLFGMVLRNVLPMHLCDWALFAVIFALLCRSQTCFELSYFWGLGGTVQALFTPAVEPDVVWWRLIGFYVVHAAIVAGVLFLLLVPKMRPQGLLRIFVWSEIYLVCALVVNALTDQNYGFLSRRPTQRTLLDIFPDPHWLYVVSINAFGLMVFVVFWLPWWFARRIRKTAESIPPA